ncbi:MAG: cation transporter [Planctomycetota bacterium]
MPPSALKTEKSYLLTSASGNLLVGCIGVAMSAISGSQAILLDGVFNLTYFVTGLFTVKVVSLVARGDDQRFPHGYAFFEPLVNGIKGTLVLGVSLMALVGAAQALLAGGRDVAVGTALGYGVFASLACAILALVTRHGAQQTQSPLVRADAENWVVNFAVSCSMLVAFAGIFLFRAIGLQALAPYVDPTVVLAVVIITIFVPVRMASNALMEMLNRAPTKEVVQRVVDVVDASLSDLPVTERFVRVTQPGRQRMVLVHVVLSPDYSPDGLVALDKIRAQMYAALRASHEATIVDVLFTTDRQWGAPLSDGGFGGDVADQNAHMKRPS